MDKSVLISGGVLALGGAGTHLRLLCKVLSESGTSVFVAATGSQWPLEYIQELQKVGVEFLLPVDILHSSQKLSRIVAGCLLPFQLRRQFTSLYCISTGNSHLYIRGLVPKSTKSFYHEIVSAPSPDSLGGKCVSSLQYIIANSYKVASDMNRTWPDIPIKVIPFLTSDTSFLPPSAREAVGTRELRVVYLGRMVSHKRPNKLVSEWHHLSQLVPLHPARLDIYGYDPTGSMIPALQAEINQNNMSGMITIHGSYETIELDKILYNADLVVLPSLMEGLPLVLVEAMRRGIPIVATAAGGTEELGLNNPDVTITSTEWDDFVSGLLAISGKLRSGQIDSIRLYNWAESRYGFDVVSKMWKSALLNL